MAVEWTPSIELFRPQDITDLAWSKVSAGLDEYLGTTQAEYDTSVATLEARLQAFGLSQDRAAPVSTFSFAIELASDFGSLESRSGFRSFGQGWQSIADIRLDIYGSSIRVVGASGLESLRELSPESIALYDVSTTADRSVSMDGGVRSGVSVGQLAFEQLFDGSYVATNGSEFDLRKVASGYELIFEGGARAEFSLDGQLEKFVDSDDTETVAVYDASGYLQSFLGPQSQSLSFERDGEGRIVGATDENGNEITFAYNNDGQLETILRAEGEAIFTYDTDGYLSSTTAPGDIEAELSYNSLGRLTSIEYGTGLQSETFAYDGLGSVTRTDGEGRASTVSYLPGGAMSRHIPRKIIPMINAHSMVGE